MLYYIIFSCIIFIIAYHIIFYYIRPPRIRVAPRAGASRTRGAEIWLLVLSLGLLLASILLLVTVISLLVISIMIIIIIRITPSPPIKSFPIKSPWVKLSGRPPIKFYGHDNSHPLELRVCLSETLWNPNS